MKKETKYLTLIDPAGLSGSWDNISVPASLLEKPFQDFINRGVAEIIRVTAVVEVKMDTLLNVQSPISPVDERTFITKPDFIQLVYFDNLYPVQIVPNGAKCSIKVNTDFANNPIMQIKTNSFILNNIVSVSNDVDAINTSIFRVITPRIASFDLRLTVEYVT